MSGGLIVLPALNLMVAGTNTSAVGFNVFFALGILIPVDASLLCGLGAAGAGLANPNGGLSWSTVITYSFVLTLTVKNFSPFRRTRNGPS